MNIMKKTCGLFIAAVLCSGIIFAAPAKKSAGKNVAVKVSTGEAGGNNYLHASLIGDFVKSIHGTIVECNTAYGGSRATTAMHRQVAKDHGFTIYMADSAG